MAQNGNLKLSLLYYFFPNNTLSFPPQLCPATGVKPEPCTSAVADTALSSVWTTFVVLLGNARNSEGTNESLEEWLKLSPGREQALQELLAQSKANSKPAELVRIVTKLLAMK